MLNLFIAFLVSVSPLIIGEVVYRRFKVTPEITRKLTHILASITSAALPMFISLKQISILALLFLLVLFMLRSSNLISTLHQTKRKSYGELMYPIGVLVAALISPNVTLYVTSILIMGFADSAAYFVGQKWPIRNIIINRPKSIGGFIAFAAVSFIICYFISGVSLLVAVTVSLLSAVVELVSYYGTDNASVPLVSALLLRLL